MIVDVVIFVFCAGGGGSSSCWSSGINSSNTNDSFGCSSDLSKWANLSEYMYIHKKYIFINTNN